MPGPFSVLFAKPEDPPANTLAQIFVKFHNITPFDGKRKVNHAWGFLGERLSQEEAERLSGFAATMGLPVVIKEESEVATLPEAKNLHRAHADPLGFHYTVGISGEDIVLPWERVALVSAVGLREESSITKTIQDGPTNKQRLIGAGLSMATGIPISLGKKEEVKKVVKSAEFFLYMDVFTSDFAERLHIDAQKLNFTGLGERMLPNAMGNFLLLLGEVCMFAGPVLKNRAARMILANQTYASMGYETRADYEKECRWLLTLCRKPT